METTLLTQDMKKLFKNFPLNSQKGKGKEATCVCAFGIGNIRWFILEGQPEGNDFALYGIVAGQGEPEYGFFALSEIEAVVADRSEFGLADLKVSLLGNLAGKCLSDIEDEDLHRFLTSPDYDKLIYPMS